jgi:transcriptional regulator with XRE-family HTH domain
MPHAREMTLHEHPRLNGRRNGRARRNGTDTARRNGAANGRAIANTDDGAQAIGLHLCDRVRDLRRKREWTLEQLSAACGVSRSMLSQIERNQANPTLGVAYRIAQAFKMSVGRLVDVPDASPSIDVVRANDRTYHYRSGADCRIRTLSPPHLENDVEFYEVSLEPGAALKSAAHFRGAREVLTVQRGRVRVQAGKDSAKLETGDSAHYPADVNHAIENVGRKEALIVLVEIYRGGGPTT